MKKKKTTLISLDHFCMKIIISLRSEIPLFFWAMQSIHQK